MIYAKVIADSVSSSEKRIVTFELNYQRFIHGEVMTHRVFSRNAMSSRAIPVEKMIEQVRNNPAMPLKFMKNKPGMQATEEMSPEDHDQAVALWYHAANESADIAEHMSNKNGLNIHKQFANRILEPFQWMRTLVTATEWDNFFELRDHPDAQPEFRELARHMSVAMEMSTPTFRENTWHMPYVSPEEVQDHGTVIALKLSTARCARVSYLTHDKKTPILEDDIALYERLVGSVPLHASPTEHQAYPLENVGGTSGNFVGWLQHRQVMNKLLP
jgi:thymidylate synthase ThyX